MVQQEKRSIDDVGCVFDQHHRTLEMRPNQMLPVPINEIGRISLKRQVFTLCNIIAIKTMNSILNWLVADAAPRAIPSAAACTTNPSVAVQVAFGFVIITEPAESRTNEREIQQ